MGGDLSARRAFVVQLSSAASRVALSGHVEHLESGKGARFNSTDELIDFMSRTLDEEVRESDEEPPA